MAVLITPQGKIIGMIPTPPKEEEQPKRTPRKTKE